MQHGAPDHASGVGDLELLDPLQGAQALAQVGLVGGRHDGGKACVWLVGWVCSRIVQLAAGAQRRQRRVLVSPRIWPVEVAVRHPHGKQSHDERVGVADHIKE